MATLESSGDRAGVSVLLKPVDCVPQGLAGCRRKAKSVHERSEGGRHVDGPERSETQRPTPTEFLAERMENPAPPQLLLVILGTLVSRRALEGGVEAIAAIVDGPDGQLVRHRASFDGNTLGIAHGVLIGSGESALEPAGDAPAKRRVDEGRWSLEAAAFGSIPIGG
jgi:hypothetical protein